MMLHEKLLSGQFLLGLKNDRSGLLPTTATTHPAHNLQTPSPPMPALDIYSAYAYQQQLQQQLLNSHMTTANPIHQPQSNAAAEVLDLSRREFVDLAYKTPSPNQTNSSISSRSPADSPNSIAVQKSQHVQHLPNQLIYAAQAYHQAQNVNNLAALYPHPYYAAGVKREPSPPAKTLPIAPLTPATTNNNNNSILKTFASAAVATASCRKNDVSAPHSPQPASEITTTTSPTSSTSHLSAYDPKNTRPFKAFPRDPLVIAANFAATDVLLDNPRVERYTEYRKRVLEQIRNSNGGSRTVTNPKMRRTNLHSGSVNDGSSGNNSDNDDRHREESSDCDSNSGQDPQMSSSSKSSVITKSNENATTNENSHNNTSGSGTIVKDLAYYERRRKNNAAAKKSRDRRRIKEDEIAIRAAYLERQNIELLCQIDSLKAQVATLTAKLNQ